eukprot:365466-Chlamydomonas_euryale.AAC.20
MLSEAGFRRRYPIAADKGNHIVRKISGNSVQVYLGIAGTPGDSGDGGDRLSATLSGPRGVTVDTATGDVYVSGALLWCVKTLRRCASSRDSCLESHNAAFGYCTTLVAADSGNHVIRKVDGTTGTVTLVAGQYGNSGSLDGIGAAATLGQPWGIVYVSDQLYLIYCGLVAQDAPNAIGSFTLMTLSFFGWLQPCACSSLHASKLLLANSAHYHSLYDAQLRTMQAARFAE